MEAFNIKIRYGSNELTLTVLPGEEEGYYKIVYYGAVLGAVRKNHLEWDLIPIEEVVSGDLPFYVTGNADGRIEIELTEHLADRIGEEIDIHLEED